MIDGYTMYVRRLNSRYKDTYLKQMKKKNHRNIKIKTAKHNIFFFIHKMHNQIYPLKVKSEQSKEKNSTKKMDKNFNNFFKIK